MKKAILLALLLGFVFVLSSCSPLGIRIDSDHFPDAKLWTWVRTCDSNQNGYLSKKEIEDAKSLIIWEECNDLTGIGYLTNLETLALQHGSDLSGIEQLTNLKTLCISEFSDLSGVEYPPDLERIEIYRSVFSEPFVFDSDTSVTEFKFKNCVFEKGIIVKNNSVENVEFDDCGVSGDVVFADCDGLTYFHAYYDVTNLDIDADFDYMKEQSYSVDFSGCDNLDHVWLENGQVVSSVDLSNCGKLRSISIYDLYTKDDVPETTLDISGCPNIEDARILEGIRELDISDCPHLISASEQTPTGEYHIEYESEDGHIYSSNTELVLINNN